MPRVILTYNILMFTGKLLQIVITRLWAAFRNLWFVMTRVSVRSGIVISISSLLLYYFRLII